MDFSRALILISAVVILSFSASSEDLVIDGETQSLSGLQEYDNVEVINGGTMAVEDYSDGGGNLTIDADSIYVDSQSTIDGTARGPSGGEGGVRGKGGEGGYGGENNGSGDKGGTGNENGGAQESSGGGGGGAASYGGIGGTGGQGGDSEDVTGAAGGSSGPTYGNETSNNISMGSGAAGGAGGGDGDSNTGSDGDNGAAGGSAITLKANNIDIEGKVLSDGGAGGDGGNGGYGSYDGGGGGGGGGGASGGGIMIEGNEITVEGALSAEGGDGGNGGSAGGGSYGTDGEDGQEGGGGRIKVFYGTSLEDSEANYNLSGYEEGTLHTEQRDDVMNQLCLNRGPRNECILNQTRSLNEDQYNVSSIFISEETADITSSRTVTFNLTNSTSISGSWNGSFYFKNERPVVKSGAKFRPENGDIRIGN